MSDAGLEDPLVRDELDRFIETFNRLPKPPQSVETVAATIFPSAFYQPHAADPEKHLYALERMTRDVVRKHPQNRRGTYFERLVAYPTADGGHVNQIENVLGKLRSAAERGVKNSNQFELALFHPKRDTNPIGFPCLSHLSITLSSGLLHGTAVYRNQYFIERAYGNLLGLGALVNFLASESGFGNGELLCVASHAEIELGRYGRAPITELIGRCEELLGVASS